MFRHRLVLARMTLALIGVGLLLVAGLAPFLGAFVALLAGTLGPGALLVTLWRGVRGPAQAVDEGVVGAPLQPAPAG